MKAVRYSIDSSLMNSLPEPFDCNVICDSVVVYFAAEAERDKFIKMFPKSLRIVAVSLYSHKGSVGSVETTIEYGARVRVLRISKITGAENEMKAKRLNRFYQGIKKILL